MGRDEKTMVENYSSLNQKEKILLRMMYNEDINAEKVMDKLSVGQKELESLVENLVTNGFLRFSGDDELELTEKGKQFCMKGVKESVNSQFKEQSYQSSNKNNFSNNIGEERPVYFGQNNLSNKKREIANKVAIVIIAIIITVFIAVIVYESDNEEEMEGKEFDDISDLTKGNLWPEEPIIFSDPFSGEVPVTVNFSAVAIDWDGNIEMYDWDFGDGDGYLTYFDENVTHTYYSPGIYTVELTVYDNEGGYNYNSMEYYVFE